MSQDQDVTRGIGWANGLALGIVIGSSVGLLLGNFVVGMSIGVGVGSGLGVAFSARSLPQERPRWPGPTRSADDSNDRCECGAWTTNHEPFHDQEQANQVGSMVPGRRAHKNRPQSAGDWVSAAIRSAAFRP